MELAQKQNQYLNGKSEAFAGFRNILAEEIVKAVPRSEDEVKKIVEGMNTLEQPKQNGVVKAEDGDHWV